MEALLFYFTDMIGFACFHEWIVYSLLAYTMAVVVQEHWSLYTPLQSILPLTLLLFQDTFINGRFGLALIYLVPAICCALGFRRFLLRASILPFLLVVFALLCDIFVIKVLILGQPYSLWMTISKIFITLIIEGLILLGMRGNRFLL